MIIKDSLLEPYHIEIEPDNILVCEDALSENGIERKDIYGYFMSVRQAIKKIRRLHLANDIGTYSVEKYVKQLVKETDKFDKIIKMFV